MVQETTVQTKFHSFLKQRNSKTNAAMLEAQRLINLYRVLGVFSPDFVDEYNAMLMNCSDEVQTALTALIGGPEVRQYLEFLKTEEHKDDEQKSDAQTSQQTGWLPSPDQEIGRDASVPGDVSESKWRELVKEQEAKMTQMIEDLRKEQNENLTRLMNQLSASLQAQRQAAPSAAPKAPPARYSEIIEEKNKEGE